MRLALGSGCFLLSSRITEICFVKGDKASVTFLLAKQRTLHVFSDNGKSIPVSLRERDGNVAVFESTEAIPVGVYVEWASAEESNRGQVLHCRPFPQPGDEKNLLEISVEFKP